jgi:uncharacterized protein (TIGR03435 family)
MTMRVIRYRLSVIGLLAGVAYGQTFEVASVKASAPGGRGGIVRPTPGQQGYMAQNLPLRMIMTVAYTVTDRQIAGGPDWMGTERWDLNAKADRPYPIEQLRVMLQKLLEERFNLKIRREKREMPVWELVVDKGAPKMSKHADGDIDHPPMGPGPNGRGMSGKNIPMSYLAFSLSRMLDRNVIDKTGLDGFWDVTLDFARDQDPNQDGPSIFTAVREQLGLRLVSAKGPVEHLVIESAERPSAN